MEFMKYEIRILLQVQVNY